MRNVMSEAAYDLDGTSPGLAVVESEVSKPAPVDSSSGNELAWKFFALGNLRGKTATEIIAGVGLPTSIHAMAKGEMLLQWRATGYHMTLLFNTEQRAVKVAAESALLSPRR